MVSLTVWLLYKFRDTVKQPIESCSSPPLPRKNTCPETNLLLFVAGQSTSGSQSPASVPRCSLCCVCTWFSRCYTSRSCWAKVILNGLPSWSAPWTTIWGPPAPSVTSALRLWGTISPKTWVTCCGREVSGTFCFLSLAVPGTSFWKEMTKRHVALRREKLWLEHRG